MVPRALLLCGLLLPALAAAQTAAGASSHAPAQAPGEAREVLRRHPWEFGPLVNGGVGTGNRSDYSFLSAGVHAGKVLTDPALGGLLRGQFEYAAEVLPFWQAYTPKYRRANCYLNPQGNRECTGLFNTGGAYTGVSVTPIILRWNLVGERLSGHRITPWVQGAGGLIWTSHKFPPAGPYPEPGHLGTSVFNFTPQFGVGLHYFIRPRRAISFSANAVHLSNASLGDSNPGVNASVQLSLGYTWWK